MLKMCTRFSDKKMRKIFRAQLLLMPGIVGLSFRQSWTVTAADRVSLVRSSRLSAEIINHVCFVIYGRLLPVTCLSVPSTDLPPFHVSRLPSASAADVAVDRVTTLLLLVTWHRPVVNKALLAFYVAVSTWMSARQYEFCNPRHLNFDLWSLEPSASDSIHPRCLILKTVTGKWWSSVIF